MANPYYNPAEMGLEIVGEIEYSSGCYEFDTRVFWVGDGGRLYTARDSGCSCPTPFETYTSIDLLDPLTISKHDEITEEIKRDLSGCSQTSLADAQDLMRRLWSMF